MATPQQKADHLLEAWQLLKRQGIEAPLRLPVIDALAEMERAKRDIRRLN